MAVKKKSTRWQGKKKQGHEAAGEATAESHRKLQRDAESRRKGKSGDSKQQGAVQAGARRYRSRPFPSNISKSPAGKSELEPRPQYQAPEYRGSEKLAGMVALITGGDSGSAGQWPSCMLAKEPMLPSST